MTKQLISVTMALFLAALNTASAETPEAQVPASWRAGYDYAIIIPSEAPELASGKIEVRELFLYTSGWSRAIQPHLEKWLKTKPDYIEFVRAPAIAFPHARLQARLFFTLQELRREDLHIKFFEWVRDPARYPTYHTVRHPDEQGIFKFNLEFVTTNGVDGQKFTELYNSKAIIDKAIGAEIATHGYLVNGTSTLVVNGKYTTSMQRFVNSSPACLDNGPSPENFALFFRMIEDLAAAELKEQQAKSKAAEQKT